MKSGVATLGPTPRRPSSDFRDMGVYSRTAHSIDGGARSCNMLRSVNSSVHSVSRQIEAMDRDECAQYNRMTGETGSYVYMVCHQPNQPSVSISDFVSANMSV